MTVDAILFMVLGGVVGLLGTLIGVGGGFIIVPVLLAAYPNASPEQVTAVSFLAIFANSLSGTISYARMHRIDYRSGGLFACATVPGAALGAWATTRIPAAGFQAVLAAMLIIGGSLMLLLGGKEELKAREARLAAAGVQPAQLSSSKLGLGIAISLAVGLIASLVGIGGGVFFVPMLVFLMGFAVHRATATSQFVLGVSSFAALSIHLINNSLNGYWLIAAALCVGTTVGAQIGASLSNFTPPATIIRILAIVLALTGIRLGWKVFAQANPPAQLNTQAVPTSASSLPDLPRHFPTGGSQPQTSPDSDRSALVPRQTESLPPPPSDQSLAKAPQADRDRRL